MLSYPYSTVWWLQTAVMQRRPEAWNLAGKMNCPATWQPYRACGARHIYCTMYLVLSEVSGFTGALLRPTQDKIKVATVQLLKECFLGTEEIAQWLSVLVAFSSSQVSNHRGWPSPLVTVCVYTHTHHTLWVSIDTHTYTHCVCLQTCTHIVCADTHMYTHCGLLQTHKHIHTHCGCL